MGQIDKAYLDATEQNLILQMDEAKAAAFRIEGAGMLLAELKKRLEEPAENVESQED